LIGLEAIGVDGKPESTKMQRQETAPKLASDVTKIIGAIRCNVSNLCQGWRKTITHGIKETQIVYAYVYYTASRF